MDEKAYVPMKAKELAMLLDIPKSQRGELQEVLDELTAEGIIGISKKGKYAKPETFSVNGIFGSHLRGFGFVTVEGMDQDVFIPEEKTGAALHGDRVQIVITSDGKMAADQRGQWCGFWIMPTARLWDITRKIRPSVLWCLIIRN